MTFSIKKRINTDLFIGERAESYIQNGEPKLSGKIEERKCWQKDQQEVGMRTSKAACLK